MTHDIKPNKETVQPQSAYSTLTGKPATDYLKQIGAEHRGVTTVHIIYGKPTNDVPVEIRKFVPPDLPQLLQYAQEKFFEGEFGFWYLQSTAKQFDNNNHRPDSQITSDNLANMFTANTTLVTERGDKSCGIAWQNDQTKNSVTSGRMYIDMFITGVNTLLTSGVINKEQRQEIIQQKINTLKAKPESIFNFRFEGSLPIDQLIVVDPQPEYLPTLLQLITQWDHAQTEAVQQIATTNNSKTRITGLLPNGTPGPILDAATLTAETRKDDVDKLIQWSKEIPLDQVFETVYRYNSVPTQIRTQLDELINAKRSLTSFRGESMVYGYITPTSQAEMKVLLQLLKLDSFDIFSASPSERIILEQRLSAWTEATHPDKRVHVREYQPILAQEKGQHAFDQLQALSSYLLSFSRQAGKE
ncbi:hypothetical protein HYV64_04110 [Candidatus Shapirobacteria bacterium]|nr:hypothetical protein [Candidatus Shapirobacteria bacterium]